MTTALTVTHQNAITGQTLQIQPFDGLRTAPYPSADSSPVVAMLGSKGEASRRKYSESLRTITTLLTGSEDAALRWESLQPAHVGMIRQALTERYSRSTVNRHIAALRSVMGVCWKMGYITHETFQLFHGETKSKTVSRSKYDTGRLVTGEEFAMLLGTCDGSPLGVRDAAMLSVMFYAGLRRSEVASLTVSQYDKKTRLLVDVVGKGNKTRPVPVPVNARLAARLNAWVAVRGNEPGPLFQSIRRGGHITGQGLTSQAVYNVVSAHAAAAGLDSDIAAHDFRRTFITNALTASGNPVLVADIAGHSNPSTTARYDRSGLQSYRDFMEKL
ncbi:MAG: tyrosine-type recombinase/integrase [Chloroflexi bacterium]|nr:tyrosine-type recombinase/integrase [Chloroflexota bacterium]